LEGEVDAEAGDRWRTRAAPARTPIEPGRTLHEVEVNLNAKRIRNLPKRGDGRIRARVLELRHLLLGHADLARELRLAETGGPSRPAEGDSNGELRRGRLRPIHRPRELS
jgi:hypothetical protein